VGLDLITRPRRDTSQSQIPASAFEFDFERRVARCPEGHESLWWRTKGREMQMRFPAATCRGWPRWGECTRSPRGRSLGLSKDYEQLVEDRRRAATPEYAREYRRQAAMEATMSHLVHQCGLRRSRYRGRLKRAWHAWTAATALNVRRLLRCRTAETGEAGGLCSAFRAAERPALRAWVGLRRVLRVPISVFARPGAPLTFAATYPSAQPAPNQRRHR